MKRETRNEKMRIIENANSNLYENCNAKSLGNL